jgi:N-acetylglucosaminyldiphosphoundecaprenol N-acetyl-beta-D-mannosaminyltransferase
MYPALRIVGTQHGYVDDGAMPAVIDRINESGAALVFVALGSPRQEQWMAVQRERLAARICQGVGGTFDVLAGHVRRAPPAWRRCGLEWLYRLLADPRRAARQRALPLFAWRVLRARVGG